MTAACTPPPGTESGTTHVLVSDFGVVALVWSEYDAGWKIPATRGANVLSVPAMTARDYRYIGPLTHPDEVAALRSRFIGALEVLRAILEADERGQGLPFQIAMGNAIALLGGTP